MDAKNHIPHVAHCGHGLEVLSSGAQCWYPLEQKF